MDTVDTSVLVRAVVSGTLDVEDVTPEANFFAIGGTSVAALAVTTRLQELLGYDIPPEVLFECDTLEQFASAVRDLAPRQDAAEAPRRMGPDQ